MSGLFVARGALDTVSHNVANAQTPGFSRQYVEQRATRPLTFYNGRGMIGTGAEIYGINQVRSFYLDKRYWAEMPILGEYSAKKSQLNILESLFNEMSATGLSSQFNDFFDILEDLTRASGDLTYRSNLLSAMDSITSFFNTTYESLKKQQSDINSEIKSVVDVINSLGQQIRTLNNQIRRLEMDGSRANDLRDQRTRLVDDLSRYVNIEVKEVETNADYAAGKYPEPEDRGQSRKKFIVMMNGAEFVNDVDISALYCKARNVIDPVSGLLGIKRNAEDSDNLYDIFWSSTNAEFNIYHPNLTGELRGLIDLRDGNNGNFSYYSSSGYDPLTAALTLNMDPNQVRVDIAQTGKLKVRDNASGGILYYEYTDYVFDPITNTAVFRILSPNAALLTAADFGAAKTLSIGETCSYKGAPYYKKKLNDLARTFAMAINEGRHMNGSGIPGVIGHVNGYDLFGNKSDKLLYTYRRADGSEGGYMDADFSIYNITAQNFLVNSEIMADNRLFGASAHPTGGESDNRVTLSFLNLRSNRSLFMEGNILDYINGMAGELAIDNRQAASFTLNYTDVAKGIDNQRMSVYGVNLDEEMIKMIKYQQQYQACAKLVNVIDLTYNTLINQMGV